MPIFNDLVKKYNESVNASDLSKIFKNKEDVEWFLDELNPTFYPDAAVEQFKKILKDVANNGLMKLVMTDDEFKGSISGTKFEIQGKNNNYITGEYKAGELVVGFGSPAQTATLVRYQRG